MELAGSYIDLMMPEKPRTAYPVQGFTTEYSGPLHEDPEHSIVCFQVTGKKSTFETLQGHKDTVLALDCAQNSAGKDMLISGGGSRDCCVKIWTQLDD